MTDARIQYDAVGLIVFDADLAPQVGHDWFDPAYWRRAGKLRARGGGRASASFIETPVGAGVLRHFHRGGMVARLFGDRYFLRRCERSRAVREFRLLERMHAMGLPVPRPLAARCVRHGAYYTADIITLRIEPSRTLAEVLAAGGLDRELAIRTGQLVARFHARGVWHADLNAHNVLVTPQALYLIDFDRGKMRRPDRRWQQANLARLRRSLVKLGAAASGHPDLEHEIWQPLVHAYTTRLAKETSEP